MTEFQAYQTEIEQSVDGVVSITRVKLHDSSGPNIEIVNMKPGTILIVRHIKVMEGWR